MASGVDVVAFPPGDLVVAERGRIGDVGQPLVVRTARVVVVDGHVPVVGHAAEHDLVAFGETPVEGLATVVPLAGTPGPVALASQRLPEHRVLLGDAAAGVAQVEQRSTRVQHGPARHADGAMGAAGNVRVCESRAPGDQAVDVRRRNGTVAECADGVEALVVGEEQQDVGLLCWGHA